MTAPTGHRNSTATAGDAPRTVLRRLQRLRFGVRLHHLLFLVFTLTAAVPIIVLALWEQRVAYQHELSSVRERHLLVARNLTMGLSRYVEDVKAAFSLAFESGGLRAQTMRKPTGTNVSRSTKASSHCPRLVGGKGWIWSGRYR